MPHCQLTLLNNHNALFYKTSVLKGNSSFLFYKEYPGPVAAPVNNGSRPVNIGSGFTADRPMLTVSRCATPPGTDKRAVASIMRANLIILISALIFLNQLRNMAKFVGQRY